MLWMRKDILKNYITSNFNKMNKIFSQETINSIKNRDTKDIIDNFLHATHDMPRSHAAILIGLRINNDYQKYSKLLLEEMAKKIHFQNVRLGIKSAWTVAISAIENLNPIDYFKIKNEFDKWDEEERQNLLEWLKHHPYHCKILKEGKV